jgi:hypothetical protein
MIDPHISKNAGSFVNKMVPLFPSHLLYKIKNGCFGPDIWMGIERMFGQVDPFI